MKLTFCSASHDIVGPILGLFVGFIVTKARIPSFIVTLGMLMIARSLTLVVTHGQPIPDMPQIVRSFGQGRWVQIPLPIAFGDFIHTGSLADLLVWFPIQNIVWVAAVVYAVVLERTAFGKRVYAVLTLHEIVRLLFSFFNQLQLQGI